MIRKKLFFIATVNCLFFLSSLFTSAFSKPLHVVISLLDLQSEVGATDVTDNVFFAVTEHTEQDQDKSSRLPESGYWSLKNNQQIKNQKLWEANVADGQAYEITLVIIKNSEAQTNGLVGSCKLTLNNVADKLEAQWMQLDNLNQPSAVYAVTDKPQPFIFAGTAGKYTLDLQVDVKPDTDKKNATTS